MAIDWGQGLRGMNKPERFIADCARQGLLRHVALLRLSLRRLRLPQIPSWLALTSLVDPRSKPGERRVPVDCNLVDSVGIDVVRVTSLGGATGYSMLALGID